MSTLRTPGLHHLPAVTAILAEQLGLTDPARITPGSTLQGDLACDSLDAVEIVMALEEHYGIELPDAAIPRLDAPAAMVSDILALLVEHNAPPPVQTDTAPAAGE